MVAPLTDRLQSAAETLRAIACAPRRDTGVTRRVYSYPAKFQAHLPAELIRAFSHPGELVADPYCGGGTTLLEAMLQDRPSFGMDLNPFAALVARVKTTAVSRPDARAALEAALDSAVRRPVLDPEDVRCLGDAMSAEIERLAGGIAALPAGPAADLALLALIHAVKLAGRRDFRAPSLRPLFLRKGEEALRAVSGLPPDAPRPRVAVGSNHAIPVEDGAAALVVTSPPYKDLDVEYALVQIQRPALGKSRRTKLIFRLLGATPMGKKALCGGTGEAYWKSLPPSLGEIRRILRPGRAAFFWTGFKTDEDRRGFEAALAAAGLPPRVVIPATLSRDRVASSRSLHHGRDTRMLPGDWLFGCIAEEPAAARAP